MMMEYKYAAEHPNYADLASGRVLYSLPGHPAFPIRLASEIYQRSLQYLGKTGNACTLFDPCCGAAYHLTVAAYLHWDSIARVICSDIDEKAVKVARRNLGLLTPTGMERRAREIAAMLHLYGKESHREALQSAEKMLEQINCLTNIRSMQTQVFQADATDAKSLEAGLQGAAVDVVFTDIPYGLHSEWQGKAQADAARQLLDSLLRVIPGECVVAVSSDKGQKLAHEGYERLEKFHAGKRQVVILKPLK